MSPEVYCQRMAEMGISRGHLEEGQTVPVEWQAQINQHKQSHYINPAASMKVKAPELPEEPLWRGERPQNLVAALLFSGWFLKQRRRLNRDELLAQARAMSHTPLDRFYVLLFERESSTAALAKASGFGKSYVTKLVRRASPTAACRRLQKHLTPAEVAALGWDKQEQEQQPNERKLA
jgi:hypothetical protein